MFYKNVSSVSTSLLNFLLLLNVEYLSFIFIRVCLYIYTYKYIYETFIKLFVGYVFIQRKLYIINTNNSIFL